MILYTMVVKTLAAVLVFCIVQVLCLDITSDYGEIPYDSGSDACYRIYDPSWCRLPNASLSTLKTVEDFDRCAPALLQEDLRNYILHASGRRLTYMGNLKSYRRYNIILHNLRDVSNVDMSTTVLGHRISAPIGMSPVVGIKLAHPDGESGAARAAASEGIVMILSSSSSDLLEDVAAAAAAGDLGNQQRSDVVIDKITGGIFPEIGGTSGTGGRQSGPVLWMQTYIHKNRENTLQLMRRAEKAGFKAIVVTTDSPIPGKSLCGSRDILEMLKFPNIIEGTKTGDFIDPSLTYKDLNWVVRNTNLPVVAKGILNAEDAIMAVKAGVSAILVSNHGGRQLDGDLPTIEALPGVVAAIRRCCRNVEVYMDGGVRSGFDVFKALAMGARAVFFGRPTLWGQAVAGSEGVKKVISIYKEELKSTMQLAGVSKLSDINFNSVVKIPSFP